MNSEKLSFKERCGRRDERHVEILEYIAENEPNPAYRMTAIRDLGARHMAGHRKQSRGLAAMVALNL